jgi:hypothetical protein
MMVLPTQLDEALRIPRSMKSLFSGGNRPRPKRIAQIGVAGLINHHKVAAPASQPAPTPPIGAVDRLAAVQTVTIGGLCIVRVRGLEHRERLC